MTALSHVSVPISPLHQRQLAFISELNVQMLYQLGLKKIVTDFLSSHSPPPLESAKTVAASAAVDPVNFEAMAAKQNRCPET